MVLKKGGAVRARQERKVKVIEWHEAVIERRVNIFN
jgi:hypothetical protein